MRFKPLQGPCASCVAWLIRGVPFGLAGWNVRQQLGSQVWGLEEWWGSGSSQWKSWNIAEANEASPPVHLVSLQGVPQSTCGSGVVAVHLHVSLPCPAGNFCCLLSPGGGGMQLKWTLGQRNQGYIQATSSTMPSEGAGQWISLETDHWRVINKSCYKWKL